MLHRILVPLDGSSLAEQALALAGTITARAGGSTSAIELVLVDTRASRPPESDTPGTPSEHVYLDGIAEEATRLLGVHVTATIVAGDPATAIVLRAEETGADMIVMTTHGRTGLSRALLGSVADRVVRDSGRPVLLKRPAPGTRWRAAVSSGFRHILVPLDGTEVSASVLQPVLELCQAMEARPILARVVLPVAQMSYADAGVPAFAVVDQPATNRLLAQTQDAVNQLALDIEADRRIRVDTSVTLGADVGKSLLEIAGATHADLIALVSHGRGASRIFLGSVVDHLLGNAEQPLLLLHPRAVPTSAEAPAAALAGA